MKQLPGVVLIFLSLSTRNTIAQAAPQLPQESVSFMAFASRARAAFSGSFNISDVRMSGSVVQTLGDIRRGTVTLVANSAGQSKVELNLNTGKLAEYHSGFAADPACSSRDSAGSVRETAIHNCWGVGAWFLPAIVFGELVKGAGFSGSDLGIDAKTAAQRWRLERAANIRPAKAAALARQLGTVDVYLDPATALVSLLRFNTHPEHDLGTDIPVEVRFSDYRSTSGVTVPYHVEKYLNGTRVLDIVIDSVAINTAATIQP